MTLAEIIWVRTDPLLPLWNNEKLENLSSQTMTTAGAVTLHWRLYMLSANNNQTRQRFLTDYFLRQRLNAHF